MFKSPPCDEGEHEDCLDHFCECICHSDDDYEIDDEFNDKNEEGTVSFPDTDLEDEED